MQVILKEEDYERLQILYGLIQLGRRQPQSIDLEHLAGLIPTQRVDLLIEVLQALNIELTA